MTLYSYSSLSLFVDFKLKQRGPYLKEINGMQNYSSFFSTSVCSWLHLIFFECGSLFVSSRQGDVPFPKKEDGTLLYDNIDYKLTWAAMEKLVGEGLVRSIGLSNFNSRQIDDILSVSSIKPTVLQVHGDDEKVYCNCSKQVTRVNATVACLTFGILKATDDTGIAVF